MNRCARTVAVWTAIVSVIVVLFLTLDRNPTNEPDAQLYGSIAESWGRSGSGVPTVLRHSPYAVDHVGFYGPVYFELTALSFKTFGLSKWSARVVSFLGALLLAAAAAALSFSLGGRLNRWPVAVLLVLLAPEVQYSASNGTMETLAVAFAVSAFALFAAALGPVRWPYWLASGAGLSLGLAALTTPRSYPLVFAFAVAGVLLLADDPRHRRVFCVTGGVTGAIVVAWAWLYHGDVIRWAREMVLILTHEDTDVAILGERIWSFSPSKAITPLVALIACVTGALLLDRARRNGQRRLDAEFTLVATAIAFALTIVGMDLTFLFGIYFAIPLFAVVIALPWPSLGVSARVFRTACAVVVGAFLICDGVSYARMAVTWEARDSQRVESFLAANVKPRSIVVGPQTQYFFTVKAAGSSYRTTDPRSFADWTRWMPPVDMSLRTRTQASAMRAASRARFLLWPDRWDLPEGYECVTNTRVATYRAPVPRLPYLTALLGGADRGYPDASLYVLPLGCPSGYDPTGASPRLAD